VIRALSLSRPWTELVLRHGKDVENRRWATSYRGPLVIHGAKSWDYAWPQVAIEILGPDVYDLIPPSGETPTGYLGVVDLVDVCRVARESGRACECGPWAFEAQYHWRITNPRPFPEAIYGPGQMGLWTPPAQVLDLVST
jgi:hypothetical protein